MRHFFLLRRTDETPWPTSPGPGWTTAAGRFFAGWQGTADNDLVVAGDPDGASALLAFDAAARRASMTTDRFGLYPVYTGKRGGVSGWATSPVLLASLLGLPHGPCPQASTEMLVFQGIATVRHFQSLLNRGISR